MLQAYVPPMPILVSATDAFVLPSDEHGPIAPATLQSRAEQSTSSVAAKPIVIWPALHGCASSGYRRNTRRKLSLKTDCPNESATTIKPPVRSTQTRISAPPNWSREQAKMSMTWLDVTA